MTAPPDSGEVLRARREALGLTLQEVASATRIPEAHLAALEEDRVDDLPAGPYAQAYRRSLRVFLGLKGGDGAPVAEAHRAVEPPAPAVGGPPLPWVKGLALVSVVALVALLGSAMLDRTADVTEPQASGVGSQRLAVRAGRDTSLVVVVDGSEVVNGPVERDFHGEWHWESSVVVDVAAVADVRITWNDQRVRPQGQQKAARRLVFVDDVGGAERPGEEAP